MANDFLAFLACLTLAAAEFSVPSSLKVSAILVAISIALLIIAFHRSYMILATLLTLCSVSFAAVLNFRASPTYNNNDDGSDGNLSKNNNNNSWCRRFLNVLPALLASAFHVLALFDLPFLILYSLIDAQKYKRFVSQELGHLVPGSFMIMNFVALPTVIFRGGLKAPKKCIKNQLYEAISFFIFATLHIIVFRMQHHNLGHDPPRMIGFDWDHELLGWVVFGSALLGIFISLAKVETDIHVIFPTVYIALNMQNHNDPAHHVDMDGSVGQWKPTWMKLHLLYGVLLLVGSVCRLVGRRTESICFYHISVTVISMSSTHVVQSVVNAFENPKDKDWASDHIIPLMIVAMATVNCAIFMGAGIRLRKFLDMDYESRSVVSFQELATEEPAADGIIQEDEEKVAYFTNRHENEKRNYVEDTR